MLVKGVKDRPLKDQVQSLGMGIAPRSRSPFRPLADGIEWGQKIVFGGKWAAQFFSVLPDTLISIVETFFGGSPSLSVSIFTVLLTVAPLRNLLLTTSATSTALEIALPLALIVIMPTRSSASRRP